MPNNAAVWATGSGVGVGADVGVGVAVDVGAGAGCVPCGGTLSGISRTHPVNSTIAAIALASR